MVVPTNARGPHRCTGAQADPGGNARSQPCAVARQNRNSAAQVRGTGGGRSLRSAHGPSGHGTGPEQEAAPHRHHPGPGQHPLKAGQHRPAPVSTRSKRASTGQHPLRAGPAPTWVAVHGPQELGQKALVEHLLDGHLVPLAPGRGRRGGDRSRIRPRGQRVLAGPSQHCAAACHAGGPRTSGTCPAVGSPAVGLGHAGPRPDRCACVRLGWEGGCAAHHATVMRGSR